MANKKISALSTLNVASIQATDFMVVARAGNETYSMTIEEFDLRYSASLGYADKYFGDPATDGSWRIRLDAGTLLIEKRVAGVYILKQELV